MRSSSPDSPLQRPTKEHSPCRRVGMMVVFGTSLIELGFAVVVHRQARHWVHDPGRHCSVLRMVHHSMRPVVAHLVSWAPCILRWGSCKPKHSDKSS